MALSASADGFARKWDLSVPAKIDQERERQHPQHVRGPCARCGGSRRTRSLSFRSRCCLAPQKRCRTRTASGARTRLRSRAQDDSAGSLRDQSSQKSIGRPQDSTAPSEFDLRASGAPGRGGWGGDALLAPAVTRSVVEELCEARSRDRPRHGRPASPERRLLDGGTRRTRAGSGVEAAAARNVHGVRRLAAEHLAGVAIARVAARHDREQRARVRVLRRADDLRPPAPPRRCGRGT